MRKIFLTTTALMGAAALSAPAFADAHEGGVKISAFSNWTASVASSDVEDNGINTGETDQGTLGGNSEIHFNWSKTSDTGITYGFKAEFEADAAEDDNGGNGGNVDENGIFFSGSFGTIRLENDDGAADRFGTNGSNANFVIGMIGNPTGSDLSTVRTASGWTGGATSIDIANDGGDDSKVSYYIPSIVPGLSAGISITPNGGTYEGGVGVGASYTLPIEVVDLTLTAAYSNSENATAGVTSDSGDAEGVLVGAQLGFAGFTLASGYVDFEADDASVDDGVSVAYSGWNVGASYSFLGVTASAGYQMIEDNTFQGDSFDEFSVGASYTLLPGVSVSAGVTMGEVDNGAGADNLDYESGAVTVSTSW